MSLANDLVKGEMPLKSVSVGDSEIVSAKLAAIHSPLCGDTGDWSCSRLSPEY